MGGESEAAEADVSVELDEFLAWMNSGNSMSERIKAKLVGGDIGGLEMVGEERAQRLSAAQFELLFSFMDDDGSGDLDEDVSKRTPH